MTNEYTLLGKFEQKRPLVRTSHRWNLELMGYELGLTWLRIRRSSGGL
jgi:hypothetical protein